MPCLLVENYSSLIVMSAGTSMELFVAEDNVIRSNVTINDSISVRQLVDHATHPGCSGKRWRLSRLVAHVEVDESEEEEEEGDKPKAEADKPEDEKKNDQPAEADKK